MVAEKTVILNNEQVKQKLNRMAFEIHENHFEEKELVIIGIDGKGAQFAERLKLILQNIASVKLAITTIKLDKRNPLETKATIHPEIELKNKVVILVDDVLNTGKTLIHATKTILDYDVKQLCTAILVNRRHRLFPIRADYVGLTLSTTLKEHITVELENGQDTVYLE